MSKKKFRIHILGLPHTKTTLDFTACAYTMKAWKFCKMMKGRGHTIFHYGHKLMRMFQYYLLPNMMQFMEIMIIKVISLNLIEMTMLTRLSIKMQLLK